jgi:hypothetical protein
LLSIEQSRVALRKLFRQRRIVDLPLLFKTLQTDSPMSVYRRLSPLGYISSYSHNGRFYTLDDVPEFDVDGLWQYQGVFFSRHGTLKSTTAHLVEEAEAGRTNKELEAALRVRVHNTLLDLVKGKRIGRELLRGLFLYVSPDRGRAAVQVARREQLQRVVPQPAREAGRPLVVEVLLEIIHGARLVTDPADILARLLARGVEVTREQVDAIFQQHGLKKTRVPRSRSSRR